MSGLFNKDMAETVEMIYEWTGPFVMDSSKAEKAFGLKGTSLNQALKETVEWCRSHPQKMISSADLVPVKADD